ncbi:MAG: FAD-dependent oxidoreductase, partial [Cyclobacteriaceae bacterium]|nr:FAD-dependent oxidoreductase [Cyclobacteriaceae bacterium]
MKNFILLFSLFLLLGACTSQNSPKTIFIVRHAEKQLLGNDPALAYVGEVRAKKLAQILEKENIKHVFSTDFLRTKSTAQPTATAANVPITTYDPGQQEEFVQQLRQLEGNILVIGHSNTVSPLANTFITEGEKFEDLTDLRDSSYLGEEKLFFSTKEYDFHFFRILITFSLRGSIMNRQQNFDRLKDKNKVWDLAVIGGGSSGLGVALDAVSRGLSVALFEKSDFAKGTSSRSTKLVHGGVRYLAQGNIGLVREALRERGRLLKNAPHLTRTQSFIIPIYSWWDRIQYTLGLKIYDWLSGSLSLGKSTFISKNENARLAIHVAQTVTDLGGCVLNYTKVTALIKSPEGKICGLTIQEEQSKEIVEIKAKMVVNATGVFADKVLQMDQPEARKTIQPSQGIHLVLDAPFLNGKDALMIPKTKDGRVLFVLPWHDKLIVGTTDTLREKAKLEPKALQQEINFILKTAKSYLSTPPRREDVRAIFAGLRPLARPKDGQSKTKEISRSHKILLSASGLLTLTGGKWTTFRKMGEDTVNF